MRTSTIFTTSSIVALLLLIGACSKNPSKATKNDPTLEPSQAGAAVADAPAAKKGTLTFTTGRSLEGTPFRCIEYRVAKEPDLKDGEDAVLVVLLSDMKSPAWEAKHITADIIDKGGGYQMMTGSADVRENHFLYVIFYKLVATINDPGERQACLFMVAKDKDLEKIHAGAVLRVPILRPSEFESFLPEARVSAALIASKVEDKMSRFQRVITEVVTGSLKFKVD